MARTAQDDEDDWRRELDAFEAAPAETEADRAGDLSSVNRRLSRPLRLAARVRIGDSGEDLWAWDLPTAAWKESEEGSLRETAERALSDCCGRQLRARIVGNAPMAFYKETYSKYFNTS